jgi:hypothetical protein
MDQHETSLIVGQKEIASLLDETLAEKRMPIKFSLALLNR